MKQLITLLIPAAILCASCTQSSNSINIEGSYASAVGTTVYLKQSVNNQVINIDSAVVDADGQFEMSPEVQQMDFYTLADGSSAFMLLAKPGTDFNLAFGENLNDAQSFQGPEESTKFYEVNKESQELNKKRENLNQRFQNGQIGREEAMQEFNEINDAWKAYAKEFTSKNPSSPAVLSTLGALHPIEDIEVFKNTLNALKPTMGQSDYVKRLEQQIQQNEKQAAQYRAQKEADAAREKLLATGKEAPEISLPNPDGKTIKLSDLKGKYVLVDFWASWCKPCRRENPNVVAAYKKYKNKDFEILSVSLDKKKAAWVNAIKADNMTWLHVSDLKFWNSEAAKTYGVNSIPFTLLLDKEGKIIAKNLRGAALSNTLEELLNA